MGFIGTTGAGKTYSIWRPEVYNLVLLPGRHVLTEAHDLPNGINLSITGANPMLTTLDSSVTTGSYVVGYGRAGKITVSDIGVSRTTSGGVPVFDRNDVVANPLDTAFCDFHINNLFLNDITDSVGNLFVARGCNITVNNVWGSVAGGLGNFTSDGLNVSNLRFKAYGVQDVCVFSDNKTGSVTKPKVMDDIAADRVDALTVGAGGIIEIQNINGGRDVFASNFVLNDFNQGASSNPHCLVFQSDGTSNLYLRNSIINPQNNAVGEGGVLASVAGDNVYLMGTYGLAGGAVVTEGAGTFTTVY